MLTISVDTFVYQNLFLVIFETYQQYQRVGLINQEFRLFPFFGFLKVFNPNFLHVSKLHMDRWLMLYPGQLWTISDPTLFREGPSMAREEPYEQNSFKLKIDRILWTKSQTKENVLHFIAGWIQKKSFEKVSFYRSQMPS